MRLPGVSLAFALGVLVHAAHAPAAATNCMNLSDPTTAEVVLPVAAPPAPVPTPLDARRLAVEQSYAAVFRILSAENGCSRFFGGPAKAAEAFNQLARRLTRRPLGDPKVAVRMSGDYTLYRNNGTGATYRLFEEATVNLDGPLGPEASWPSAARMQVGRFAAHTPPGRALILLHELGHLVTGPRGDWLLPNDGRDFALSERNTREVEAHCVEQLKAVRD